MWRAVGIAVGVVVLAGGLAAGLGGPTLVALALVALATQWVAFVPAFLLSSERSYDLVGSLTYASLVLFALLRTEAVSFRGSLLAACVLVWAIRLGAFLATRVARAGKDRRFDALKHSGPRFFVAWTLQGLWTFLTPLPVWVVILRPVDGLTVLDGVGFALWAGGFAIEVVADAQKARFRARPESAGRFITTGLWAWSRHPNYFGEIALWVGVFAMAASQLRGVEWLAALSPAFVAVLLVKGSGVPLLEQHADATWGGDPDYEAYKARTPVLIPRPPRA